MNENRRKMVTRQKIEEAFLWELEEKSMERIRITDICKRADVNRGTFYSHYRDIYDLADQICQQVQREVEELYSGRQREELYSDGTFFRSLLCHIQEHQALFNICFKLRYDEVVVRPENYDLKFAEKMYDPEHIEYHMVFFKAGFNAIVRKWLDGGCKEPPEEIAKIIKDEYRGKIF